jgi:hypothetical protein
MANHTIDKGKAVENAPAIPAEDDLRLRKVIFPEWQMMKDTWDQIHAVKKERATASYSPGL